jgi:hypothetical protein
MSHEYEIDFGKFQYYMGREVLENISNMDTRYEMVTRQGSLSRMLRLKVPKALVCRGKGLELTLTRLNSVFGAGQQGGGSSGGFRGHYTITNTPQRYYINVAENFTVSNFKYLTEQPIFGRQNPRELFESPKFQADFLFVSEGAVDFWERFSVRADLVFSFPGEVDEYYNKNAFVVMTNAYLDTGTKEDITKCVRTSFQYNDRPGRSHEANANAIKGRMEIDYSIDGSPFQL